MGVIAIIELWYTLPSRLWNEASIQQPNHEAKRLLSLKSLRRIDVFGSSLILAASVLLVTALQQAATGYAWNSGYVLPLLIISLPSGLLFMTWQWYITTRRNLPEPIFPWRFCQSRINLGMIL